MRRKFITSKVTFNMAAFNARVIVRSLILPRLTTTQLTRSPKYCIRTLTTEAKKEESAAENKSEPTKENETTEEINVAAKQLQEEKEKLQKQLDEITDKYKRSLAETENVRTRNRKQIEETRIYAIQGFCKDLLEVADVLHAATESVPKEELGKTANSHLKSLFEGLKMTEAQLLKVFSRHGLVPIDPAGEKFDPNQHEAMFTLPTPDKVPGTVAVVTKIGYRLKERTVRPALVGVAKAP
ncbi:grpE protein homolog 1, mitochondrial-like [Glandiceps talaboti]